MPSRLVPVTEEVVRNLVRCLGCGSLGGGGGWIFGVPGEMEAMEGEDGASFDHPTTERNHHPIEHDGQ